MAGAVDQGVDASETIKREIDEALEIVVGLVRSGDADPAELLRESLALPGRREDRDRKPVRGELLGRRCTHPAAACRDHCDLCRHRSPPILSSLFGRPDGATAISKWSTSSRLPSFA
jgi:hypothetical protein